MGKNLLPLGSVVLLEGEERRIMIIGRIQAKENDDTIYDYSGCFYPVGLLDSEGVLFFQHESIASVFFIGFQDSEEFEYQERLANLGELQIVDGYIVEADRLAEQD